MQRQFERLIKLSVVVVLCLVGCGPDNSPPRLGKQDPFWSQLINAHSAGIVPRQHKVKVRFVDEIASLDKIGQAAAQWLEVFPPISGKAVFRSANEVELAPEKPLTPGAWYRVKVKAGALPGAPAKLADYEFAFQVMRKDFEVDLGALAASDTEEGKLRLAGSIRTADSEEPGKVEKMLLASLENHPLKVRWEHDGAHNRHAFSVEGIEPAAQARTLKVAWTGEPIQVAKNDEEEIPVPKKDSFEITGAKASYQPSQHIELTFSRKLDARQSWVGLVSANEGSVQVKAEGSVLRVYPETRFTGSVEIKVDGAIRDAKGNALGRAFTRTLVFANEKPQVRFTGKGIILPDNPVLSIPFEAINVQSVQVTALRVYDNNMVQFFQTNALDGVQEIDRVGRHLWRKTITLPAASTDKWQRYQLDATQLLREHPGGLFRLTLSINRGNSRYGCGQQDSAVPAKKEDQPASAEDLNVKEASYWDPAEGLEGGANNQDGSQWAERENPCKDAYYQHGQGVRDTRSYVASNIGLLAKRDGRNGWVVVSSNLRTAEPLSGTKLTLLNFQNQAMASAVTDAKGFARIELKSAPFLVQAEHQGQKGYLKVNAAGALPTSHFDVGGDKTEAGIKGFIYGERGVWRPGDEVFLTFVLQDKDAKLPAAHPVTMHLSDPKGQLVSTLTNNRPVNGFYTFTFKTAEDAPTGNWTAKAQLGGSVFTKTLKIETVIPNRLKVDLDFGRERLSAAETPSKGKLAAAWLHGASAAGLKADVKVRMQAVPTQFSRYADYVFDDPARRLQSEESTVFEGNLDNKGEANFETELAATQGAPGALAAQFASRVFEEGGAFSTSVMSMPYYPYRNFVGIKLPKGDASRDMLLTDKKHSVSIATVDAQGKPVSIKEVKVELYKIDWKWWWDKTDDNLSQFASQEHTHAMASGVSATKNGQGEYVFEIKYPEWGRFLVRACDTDGGHCTGRVFYIDWPGWAGRAREGGGAGANVLSFGTDKAEYKVGEVASLQLPEATQGRALLTIETGSRILDQRWIELRGEKGKATRVEVPITAEMSPTAYAAVTLIQPHQGKDNDRPIRLYGVVPLKVQDPNTILKPQINAADEWRPQTKAKVQVSEASGRAMTYTLAVVDEGLLGLTAFKTPDLHAHFYRKESLGITTWDLYDYVAGAYGAELERLLSLGGDEALKPQEETPAKRRFPPVVKFFGPFELKAKETRAHEVALPQYIGAVRVMVVAAQGGAYGQADKSVPVRDPLSLIATLPRVFSPGEEVTVPVSLFVMNPGIKEVALKLESDEYFEVLAGGTAAVRFDKPGEKLALLRLKAGQRFGKGTIRILASGGEHQARTEIFADVRSPNPATTDIVSAVIQPGETWQETLRPKGVPGTNEINLEVSSIYPLNLEKNLDYLVHYPHGCVEQTTSGAFPQLYLKRLVRMDENRAKEVEKNVRGGIERLRTFQTVQGGFAYWPGEFTSATQLSHYDLWSSSYAGHFLVEAERAGYPVPPSMIENWTKHQRSVAQAWNPEGAHGLLDQAYRLYTLALAQQAELGAMNRLRESKELTGLPRWLLAAAYHLAGQKSAAQELARGLSLEPKQGTYSEHSFGSNLRDRAMMLMSAHIMGDADNTARLAKAVSMELTDKTWDSTHSLGYALLAMGRLNSLGGEAAGMTYEQTVGKQKATQERSNLPVRVQQLKPFPDGGDTLSIRNTSPKPLFVFVYMKGAARLGEEVAGAKGISLSAIYQDMKGKPIATESLAQGTDFVAKVTVKNLGQRQTDNIALSHLFPSGWEIHNERLAEESGKAPEGIDYQDIRDDRVYSYFSLKAGESKTITVRLNATYLGQFYLPSIAAEAMYDAAQFARTKGRWVKVEKK
ncbi:MAG: alpha-2-macroglobulin family protein [Burkholderiales bacterium]